jgi:signal transduction histidine kinase
MPLMQAARVGRLRFQLELPLLGDCGWNLFTGGGPEIKPENIKQIFDPFSTTNTKDSGKGAGLRLFISYDTVQKLGGSIQVEIRQTGGYVLTVVLPLNCFGTTR